MNKEECPGLNAASINDWLAGIGIASLHSGIKLHFDSHSLSAVLSADSGDPVGMAEAVFPDMDSLTQYPLGELKWNVTAEAFGEIVSRRSDDPDLWTVTSAMTDVRLDSKGNCLRGRFNAPVSKGLTLHRRLLASRELCIGDGFLRKALDGTAPAEDHNGLGFDVRRIGPQGNSTKVKAVPAVEVLAFHGLRLFPVDSDGWHSGCRRDPDGKRRFYWPAWSDPLDVHAIRAMLKGWRHASRNSWDAWRIHAAFRCVEYSRTGETTAGFASEMHLPDRV